MFAVSITIATVNLGLNIKSFQTTKLEIYTIRTSIDRLVSAIATRLVVRGILNLANGYEPLNNDIENDRWTLYKNLL